MEEIDWSKVSETTKAEMEAGRKALAENQARYEQAMKSRAAEELFPQEDVEAKRAADEAKPLQRKVKAEAKGGGT